MAFSVDFMQNKSPVEKIGKNLQAGITITGVSLKKDCSILKPVLHVGTSQAEHDIFLYNYMKIPQFNNRYYFIDDIVSVGQNRWEVSGHIDVLETYKSAILAQDAVIKRQEKLYNLYLNDPDFMTYNDEQLQTLYFSSTGFLKTLSYVLVVNGS